MALRQRPPTTSGIVVLSGSEMFGLSGDFPVVQGLVFNSFPVADGPTQLIMSSSPQTVQNAFFSNFPSPLVFVTPEEGAEGERQANYQLATVLRVGIDTNITSTNVTTSGIVLLDIYPGAGVEEAPWVPPVVINARLFPLYQGPFPEHNLRIYPVLPQYSTLTPGD